MNDCEKLVKALRCCATMTCKGDECKYMILGCHDCFPKLHNDAAAAIEALQAQLPKRGEWIRVQEVDIPGEIHPVAFKCMCSVCRNEYLFPKIPRYCPDCGSMNTAKTEVQE